MDIWGLKGYNTLIVDDFHEMRLMLRDIMTPLDLVFGQVRQTIFVRH